MRDNVLWRKIARITLMISESLHVSSEKALDLFYSSKVYSMLVDSKYGLQTMSDAYILEEFISELRHSGAAIQRLGEIRKDEIKDILIEMILKPALNRLYHIDYNNILFGVSERNICARLAHHIENIMREYDKQHGDSPFIGYYADVEYNRMGNGELKQYENSLHRPQYMVSDLLVQSRGYERNLLAIEMKRKGNNKKVNEDKRRLMSLVSSANNVITNRCVHDTLLGAFIVYSPEEVTIEFYENVHGHGQKVSEERLHPQITW